MESSKQSNKPFFAFGSSSPDTFDSKQQIQIIYKKMLFLVNSEYK